MPCVLLFSNREHSIVIIIPTQRIFRRLARAVMDTYTGIHSFKFVVPDTGLSPVSYVSFEGT